MSKSKCWCEPDTIRNIGATFCKITLKYCLLNDVFSFIRIHIEQAVDHVSIISKLLSNDSDISNSISLQTTIKLSLKHFCPILFGYYQSLDFWVQFANTNWIICICLWCNTNIKIKQYNSQDTYKKSKIYKYINNTHGTNG